MLNVFGTYKCYYSEKIVTESEKSNFVINVL